MTESLCGVLIYSSNLHIMTSPRGGPFEFHNIQEIVDIEWLFELICIFFVYLSSSLQMIRKRGNNSKTGESSKLLLYKNVSIRMECVDTSHH